MASDYGRPGAPRVRVTGYWSTGHGGRWMYRITCDACGEYSTTYSAALFPCAVRRADEHAHFRKGFGWQRSNSATSIAVL